MEEAHSCTGQRALAIEISKTSFSGASLRCYEASHQVETIPSTFERAMILSSAVHDKAYYEGRGLQYVQTCYLEFRE